MKHVPRESWSERRSRWAERIASERPMAGLAGRRPEGADAGSSGARLPRGLKRAVCAILLALGVVYYPDARQYFRHADPPGAEAGKDAEAALPTPLPKPAAAPAAAQTSTPKSPPKSQGPRPTATRGPDRSAQGVAPTLKLVGKVVHVRDGDGIVVQKDSQLYEVRVASTDCPELFQPYGPEASEYAASLVLGRQVTLLGYYTDPYGRLVAEVVFDGDLELGQEMLKAGMAWHGIWGKWASDPALRRLQDRARARKLGLWKDPDPVPPWKARRGN